MSGKYLLANVIFKYVMFFLFMYFLISSVQSSGWGFFPILFALIATNDFVQGTRMAQLYHQIKKSQDKKNNKK